MTRQPASPIYPSVIAWEVTRRCDLKCRHCRGAAQDCQYADELSTQECLRLIDGVAALPTVARPHHGGGPGRMVIFTGGEPMMRPDLLELVRHAAGHGLTCVLAPCGHLLDDRSSAALLAAGLRGLSISLDAPTADRHDAFRGVPGAFERSLAGLASARRAGLRVQINCTVTRLNVGDFEAMHSLALDVGAAALDFFFLVPTGRGASLRELTLGPTEAEAALARLIRLAAASPLRVKSTCAPQAMRLAAGSRSAWIGSGCLAGREFIFVSHRGVLQPCGFLERSCGNLRAFAFDFKACWDASPNLASLHDRSNLAGKCGFCEFAAVCGGCRARAEAATGDYLDADPCCPYQPRKTRPSSAGAQPPGQLGSLPHG